MRKQRRNQKELIESTYSETTPFVAVETAGETVEEHSDRSTANVEAESIAGEGHHARYLHSVAEAGSIVLHASNNMNEGKKMVNTVKTVKEQARQQQQKRLKIFQKRRGSPNQRQKMNEKTARHPTNSRRLQRRSNIPGIKSAKKKVLITKIKDETGETITSRKGIANVFWRILQTNTRRQ